MSRKYHPDANINNPNKEQAEEKFKEIQQAYEQIMKEREYGSNPYGNGDSAASEVRLRVDIRMKRQFAGRLLQIIYRTVIIRKL